MVLKLSLKMENMENVSMFFDNIYKNVKEVIFEFKNPKIDT